MNVLFWVLQGLLAMHTVMGAVWKLSNSEQTVPSLQAIPHGAWLAMSVLELACSLGLILPAFNRRVGILVPIAALCIAAEMLLFSGLELSSSNPDHGHVVYWLVVVAVCCVIVYGRLVLVPLHGLPDAS